MEKTGLPIEDKLPEILETIHNNRVSIVAGETGCGKSTVIPAALFSEQGGHCRIICTQPRRLACKNVASRVAMLTNQTLGEGVGYHVKALRKATFQTKILFVTTGMMLQYLLHQPTRVCRFDYVILDEVHERELDLDFALLIIRCLMSQYTRFKLILMSATIDLGLFARYFSQVPDLGAYLKSTSRKYEEVYCRREALKREEVAKLAVGPDDLGKRAWGPQPSKEDPQSQWSESPGLKRVKLDSGTGHLVDPKIPSGGDEPKIEEVMVFKPAPTIEIKVKPKHRVDHYFLDTLSRFFSFSSTFRDNLCTYDFSSQTPQFIEEVVELSLQLIGFILRSENEVTKHMKLTVPQLETFKDWSALPAAAHTETFRFLVFLPGLSEIYYFQTRLKDYLAGLGLTNFEIMVLHSQTDHAEELKNLDPVKRYFLLATNVAESSITISNIGYVIDFCLAKSLVIKKSGATALELAWTSQASSRQRRGRTGRVNNGYCFHMVKQSFYDSMTRFTVPEIHRIPLDKTILQCAVIYGEFSKSYEKYSGGRGAMGGEETVIIADAGKFAKEEEREDVQQLRSVRFLANLFSSPFRALSLALEPPTAIAILDSLDCMVRMRAIVLKDPNINQERFYATDFQSDLASGIDELIYSTTFFGDLYRSLPCEANQIRLIMMGKVLGCLEECMILVSVLSCRRSLFRSSMITEQRHVEQFYKLLRTWSQGRPSDYTAQVNAYQQFERDFEFDLSGCEPTRGRMKLTFHEVRPWADKHFLDTRALFEIYEQKAEIAKKLGMISPQFVKVAEKTKPKDEKEGLGMPGGSGTEGLGLASEDDRLSFAVACAFFPSIVRGFVRGCDANKKEVEYIQSKFEMNTFNVLKIENTALSSYLDKIKSRHSPDDLERIKMLYRVSVESRLRFQYPDAVRKVDFSDLVLTVEFEEAKADESIAKILFTNSFQFQERSVAKIYSLMKGNYRTFVSEESHISPFSEAAPMQPLPPLRGEAEVRGEIGELIKQYTRVRCLHGLEFERSLDRTAVSVLHTSLTKLQTAKGMAKSGRYFATHEINERNNLRHFCRSLCELPQFDCMYELLLLLFSARDNWIFDRHRVLEMLAFEGSVHRMGFVWEDEDLEQVGELRQAYDRMLVSAEGCTEDIGFFGILVKLLKKKRVQFYTNERWYLHYEREQEERAQLTGKSFQKTESEVPVKGVEVNLKGILAVGKRQTAQISKMEDKFERYTSWKRKILSDLSFAQRVSSLSSARLMCRECDARIIDVQMVSENLLLGHLRKLTPTFAIVLNKVPVEGQALRVLGQENFRVQEVLNVCQKNELQINTLVYCAGDHLVGFGFANPVIRGEPVGYGSVFLASFCDVYLKFPNDSNAPFDIVNFDQRGAVRRERELLEQREDFLRGCHCLPCDFRGSRGSQEWYGHFQSREHLENIHSFEEIMSNQAKE